MPAVKKRYYSTKDIREILDVSVSKANQIMHMFEYRGQLLRDGRMMRVEITTFEEWLKSKVSAI